MKNSEFKRRFFDIGGKQMFDCMDLMQVDCTGCPFRIADKTCKAHNKFIQDKMPELMAIKGIVTVKKIKKIFSNEKTTDCL